MCILSLGPIYWFKITYILLKIFFNKKEKAEIKCSDREINKLLSELSKAEETVYIFTYSFFDKDGKNYFFGGGERYAVDLSKIIESFGYKPIIIQCGNEKDNKPWVREHCGIKILGVNISPMYFSNFVSKIRKSKLKIYSGVANWEINPDDKSILISHGICWDNPHVEPDIFILKNILSKTDSIISVDTNTISWFRSTFPTFINKYKFELQYIPNYVDLEKYYPVNKKHSNTVKIVYPRRCSEERGFWLIANCIPELLNEFSNIYFECVGFAHTKAIEKKINKIKELFPERFNHIVCSADEMDKIYKDADISIIPTLFSEGTSLSCIEAMACGNSVISTNIGGLPNLIINNYNGLLINPNEKELLESIKLLVKNPELRNKLSENAIKVSKEFSKKQWDDRWKHVLTKYLI